MFSMENRGDLEATSAMAVGVGRARPRWRHAARESRVRMVAVGWDAFTPDT